jgi:FkbM family methyltransferase
MSSIRQWAGRMLLRLPAPLRSLRRLPFLGGLIHRLSHRILPSNERLWTQVREGPLKGIWFELNPRTGQGFFRGDAENAGQQLLANRLRPGMVFYDLGANIGLYSLLAARIVGDTGYVYSFEPDAEVAARLRRNVVQNGFTNVIIVEAGVWSTSGDFGFVVAGPSSPDRATGTFVPKVRDSVGMKVRCIALDDFISTAPPPQVIKCDVEHAEVKVLHGARKLIETSRPWIYCELHSEENRRAVCEFLSSLAYSIEIVGSIHIVASPDIPSE